MRSFRGSEELLTFARRAVVPLHIEGRKNIDREVWSLSRYLLALSAAYARRFLGLVLPPVLEKFRAQ